MERIGEAEYAVMEVLWKDAPLTATEVAERVPAERGWSIRTVKTMLARLLASMKDDTGRVTIAGYYDDVVPLTAAERRAIAAIPRPDEMLLVIAMTTGPRPHERVGGLRADQIAKFDGQR